MRAGTAQTLSAAYIGKLNKLQSASPITLTIPANATDPIQAGVWIDFVVPGAGAVTISPAGGVTIQGATSIASGGWFSMMKLGVITSYSIHYTKLYESNRVFPLSGHQSFDPQRGQL